MGTLETLHYRHIKTGDEYLVLHEAINEADMAPVVIYQSLLNDEIWVRPKAEFFDGRFEPMAEYEDQEPSQ